MCCGRVHSYFRYAVQDVQWDAAMVYFLHQPEQLAAFKSVWRGKPRVRLHRVIGIWSFGQHKVRFQSFNALLNHMVIIRCFSPKPLSTSSRISYGLMTSKNPLSPMLLCSRDPSYWLVHRLLPWITISCWHGHHKETECIEPCEVEGLLM